MREASWSLETFSPALWADLSDQKVYDLGDLVFQEGKSLEDDLDLIERTVAETVRKGLLPVLIGGEHLITLPAYRAASRLAGGRGPVGGFPALLHYDAHADLRDDHDGRALTHATVVRRIADLAGGRSVYQFGVRSGEREEMAWGRENVNRPKGTLTGATRRALRALAGCEVYLTVDLDVLDPAQAPGTGCPEPGGPTVEELLAALRAVGRAAAAGAERGGIDLVGVDLVEVSPDLDPSGRTQVVAAKIIRELLIARWVREA